MRACRTSNCYVADEMHNMIADACRPTHSITLFGCLLDSIYVIEIRTDAHRCVLHEMHREMIVLGQGAIRYDVMNDGCGFRHVVIVSKR